MRARRVPDGTKGDVRLLEALSAFGDASVRASTIDPVTTELVRLRCARHHDCRVCQSGRLEPARAAGLDEAMADKVDMYWLSDLPERQKLALRYADTLMTQPGDISDDVRLRLLEHFTSAELVQIALLVMKFNYQKVHVSLGTDEAPAHGKLVAFDFGPEGGVDRSSFKVLEVSQSVSS